MSDTSVKKNRRLTSEEWIEAAELNELGYSQKDIADRFGCSLRSVASHLPVAIARLEAAKRTASAPASVPKTDDLPDITDIEACGRYTRSRMWRDMDALAKAMRREIEQTSPNGRAIRALTTASEGLKNVWQISRDVARLDDIIDEAELPQIVVREISAEEVQAIRDKQRREDAGVDDAEMRVLLKTEAALDTVIESEIVEEVGD